MHRRRSPEYRTELIPELVARPASYIRPMGSGDLRPVPPSALRRISCTGSHEATSTAPACVSTRLTGLDDTLQRDLVRSGYVMCDTALRRWVKLGVAKPPDSNLAPS